MYKYLVFFLIFLMGCSWKPTPEEQLIAKMEAERQQRIVSSFYGKRFKEIKKSRIYVYVIFEDGSIIRIYRHPDLHHDQSIEYLPNILLMPEQEIKE